MDSGFLVLTGIIYIFGVILSTIPIAEAGGNLTGREVWAMTLIWPLLAVRWIIASAVPWLVHDLWMDIGRGIRKLDDRKADKDLTDDEWDEVEHHMTGR